MGLKEQEEVSAVSSESFRPSTRALGLCIEDEEDPHLSPRFHIVLRTLLSAKH